MSKPTVWLLLAAMLAAGRPAAAQDTASLGRALREMQLRHTESRERVAEAEARARSTPDDSLLLSGATVLLKRNSVPEAELARVREAFADAEAELRRQLGASGAELLQPMRWLMSVRRSGNRLSRPYVGFDLLSESGRRTSMAMLYPLNVEHLRDMVLREAGIQLSRKHGAIGNWLSGGFGFMPAEQIHYYGMRDLAVHGSATAARCARGVAEDCRTILTSERREPVSKDDLDVFYGPRSPRDLRLLRQSLLQYVIDRVGEPLVASLEREPRSSSALAVLATSTGTTELQLIADWHAETLRHSAARAGSTSGLALSATAWVLLLAVVATRRRPR